MSGGKPLAERGLDNLAALTRLAGIVRHHGLGIQTTVPVSPTLQGVRAGRDEVLEKGVEIVSRSVSRSAARA